MEPLERKIRDFWPLLLGEGLVLILLGIVAVILPPIAGLAISVLLGWLLIVTALADAIVTVTQPQRPGLWWSLASDLLALGVGAVLFAWPAGGVVSLSLALASFLLFDGGIAIMLSLAHKRSRAAKWTWLALNGVLDLVLAIVILAVLPQSAAWSLGLILGLDLIFAGSTMLAMALDEREERARSHHPHGQKAAAG